jgi:hypothetical protein
MERLTKDEVKTLSDREVKIAYERISRDYSFGLLYDKVTPVENTKILAEELRERGYRAGN